MQTRRRRAISAFMLAVVGVALGAPGAPTMPAKSQTPLPHALPAADIRAQIPPHTLNTPRAFPQIATLADWETRRAALRQQILVSLGLYPLPPKTPLRANIFDRVERDGYTIEKVYFQTYPGFYLAGNLYRPAEGNPKTASSKSSVRHPGVLIAHGHGEAGRMTNNEVFSIPARAITFARQGYVAFTYDMVGYNDTRQIPQHRHFANDARHWLWGISLMGLQTWNSIRALDFLSSLPDVDTSRLAITGESGGGTQTMLLGAIDDRLAAVGPCVMVSHTMQGGCLCENAPGLRVDYSNMEIAAAAAPRPQIMVGASGDWTSSMMTVEGPSVESIYKLYGKPKQVQYVLYDYGHNINKTSREAVYRFFGKWLLDEKNAEKMAEPPFQMEPVESLRVFPDNTPLPKDAKSEEALTASLQLLAETEINRRKPHDKRSLTLFQKTFTPAWQHTLLVETPEAKNLLSETQPLTSDAEFSLQRIYFGRAGRGDSIPGLLFTPKNNEQEGQSSAVLLLHPKGKTAFLTKDGKPGPLAAGLLAKGRTVLLIDTFLTGERADAAADAARKRPFGEFFSAYNRTDLQERVQDIITASAYLRALPHIKSVALAGAGQAGLWALLAAPAADKVAADCDRLDLITDDGLLGDNLYVPCLRRMGDFRTAAVLAAPQPLLLHNTGEKFTASAWIDDVYKSLGASQAIQISADRQPDKSLLDWLTK